METGDLIKALSADAGRPHASLGRLWALATLAAIAIAAAVFFAMLGPRPDIAAAAHTADFLFKFLVTGLLALSALPLLFALSRPEATGRGRFLWLAAAPVALAVTLAIELGLVPSSEWGTRLIGVNSPECVFLIMAIGAGPLALFIAMLRHAAPTRPALAGAIAGLAAGGIGATLYAAHCTDDSPLFVAFWYSQAIIVLAIAGGLGARIFARW